MADGFIGVEVEGARELRRIATKVAGPEAKATLKKGHKAAAELVAPTAQAKAPKRTGTLAANIRPLGSVTKAQVAVGGARVPYAGPIHGGWAARNIAPQPFLTDAVSEEWPQIYESLDDLYYPLARKLETTN